MGSWFSNFSVRKCDLVTVGSVADYITEWMCGQTYLPADSNEEADGVFAIATTTDSPWISVYSDMFGADTPEVFQTIAEPMSQMLHTDLLGIACFDSDYLYLNLINWLENVNAWVGIGSAAGLGIKRRTGLSSWKNKVKDFDAFRKTVRKKYIFAEDVLTEIEPYLQLPLWQSAVSYEDVHETAPENSLHYLYFKLPEERRNQDPPVFVQRSVSLMPCFLESPSLVECNNIGGASRGLSVYFLGSYVEQEEITFSEVFLIYGKDSKRRPIQLEKVQMPDGKWAYCYHDPGFKIPEKVDPRLPLFKRLNMEMDREITVRFIPHGNPRKILDITVVFVPDKNPAGQTCWNLVQYFGSKKALIEHYNASWSESENCPVPVLREEDFD